jgi:hypothetical protein
MAITFHIQNIQKNGHSMVQYIITVASSFGRNISSTTLQGHHPHLMYLQPKEDYLYGCGVSHIRIGKSMSLPP